MELDSIDIDSSKMARKLRAIAKHAEELADELDAIDNAWQCDCGSFDYEELKPTWTDASYLMERCCKRCSRVYVVGNSSSDEDLPTRLEGSD